MRGLAHAAIACAWLTSMAPAQGPSDGDLFERRVRPLLLERCSSCHGPEKQRGGLRVDHIKTLLAGGSRGPAVDRAAPTKSLLLRAVRYDDIDLQMPPKGRLSKDEIRLLEDWTLRGAPWPEEPLPASPKGVEAFDLERRRASHWAWQPLKHVAPPTDSGSFGRHPIDAFIAKKLRDHDLVAATSAPKNTLLRRAAFDLLGLPPAPDDLMALAADDSPNAFERAVDRLLDSPHFGERWARHWMDLVRYAESHGHEFDYPIAHAWHYRDYLIRAFNADVPYDQFVREHIAGDLLRKPRLHPDRGTNESILATGSWFFGQATHAPVDIVADEAERVDNQIDVFSKTFLGLTVSCARCHDHKFDAISAADYYALFGIFKGSRRQHAFLDAGEKIAKITRDIDVIRNEGRKILQDAEPDRFPSDLDKTLLAAMDVLAGLETEGTLLEAESLDRLELTHGHYRAQKLSPKEWTLGSHMWWTDARPGHRLVLGFAVPRESRYRLALKLTKARDYGIVRVSVNDAVAQDAIDLYSRRVESTGPVDLGVHALGNGTQRLVLEIVGAHPDAVKSFMVGLDWLKITPEPPGGFLSRDALKDRAAREFGVEAAALDGWVDALKTQGGERFEEPLAPLVRAARMPDTGVPALVQEIRKLLRDGPDADPMDLIATFDAGRFDPWFVSGQAFGEAPTTRGEWDALGGGMRSLSPGVAHSGRYSRRHRGALRSPTFVLTKPNILYRVKGHGGKIRVVIDSYVMDIHNDLLFRGISFDVNHGDAWKWHHQGGDLGKFVGHRAHIEILDEGDGWIAVDEIRFSDGGLPADDLHFLSARVAREGDPQDRAALASATAHALEEVWAAWKSERALLRDIELIDWLRSYGALRPRDATAPKKLEALASKIQELAARVPEPVMVLAAANGTGEDEHVFLRGSHKNKGPLVPRRFLEAIAGKDQAPITEGTGRLELAERVLHPKNPLTARVMVNRVWHHLFGRGLVPTTDDFGVMGQPPSHPELLDWLASWFSNEGNWSVKALIRLIVSSRTWQMSSTPNDPSAEAIDPTNDLLHRARVRRLDGEALRDAMLAISGRLDRTLEGPSVPIALTPFMTGRGRPGGGPIDGLGRRSVYVAVIRNFLSPMMLAFDTPLPFSTVGRRSVSNVPAQALTLMNDPFVIQQAEAWARRVLADASTSPRDRIQTLYRQSFGRDATEDEIALAIAFLQRQTTSHSSDSESWSTHVPSWSDLCHVLFNAKEFLFLN